MINKSNSLLENLNFEQENLDKVVKKINIPYVYLGIDIRGNINNIINRFIKPNLQDALRSKKESSILGGVNSRSNEKDFTRNIDYRQVSSQSKRNLY